MWAVRHHSHLRNKGRCRSTFYSQQPAMRALSSAGGDDYGGRGRKRARWSDAPEDLLELILDRLPSRDSFSFAAVCRQWRAVQVAQRTLRPPCPLPSNFRLPWLAVFREGVQGPRGLLFYSSCERRCHRLRLPDQSVYFATRGWMMVVPIDARPPYLLNPVSGAAIVLPRLPFRHNFGRVITNRVLLSAAPADPAGCVVLMNCFSFVLLLRLGSSDEWVRLRTHKKKSCTGFVAVAGRFFGHFTSDRDLLLAVNALEPTPRVEILNMRWPARIEHMPFTPSRAWLAECSGELFRVVRFRHPRRRWEEEGGSYELFKADLARKEWIRMESTHCDFAIFLDTRSAICIPRTQLPGDGGARAGCIYQSRKELPYPQPFEEGSVSSASQLLPIVEMKLWSEFDLAQNVGPDGDQDEDADADEDEDADADESFPYIRVYGYYRQREAFRRAQLPASKPAYLSSWFMPAL